MTRSHRRGASAIGSMLIAAACGLGGTADVPTLTLHRAAFSRTVIAEGNLEPEQATPVTAPIEAEGQMRIAWLVPDGSRVKEGEVVVRFDPTEMDKELTDGRADRASAESRIEAAKAQSDGTIRNLERDADMARREMDYAAQFQSKDAEIFSRADIIQSEIDSDLAERKLDTANAVRAIHRKLGQVDLDLLSIERKKADLKIEQAQKGLAALEIKAPHDGILVYKRDWRGQSAKVGDTVWSGEPLAEIPRLDSMQAKVFVLEADAGGLTAGLPAKVFLEAHPGTTYAAKIKKVDSLARRRVGWIPVQYFGVTLELERTDPETMKPGARLQATLTLDARPDALSVPRSAVFEKDGKKVVYRRKGWSFEPAEVELSSTAVGRVVVEKGLSDGDVIALRDPTKPSGAPAGSEEKASGPSGPRAGGMP